MDSVFEIAKWAVALTAIVSPIYGFFKLLTAYKKRLEKCEQNNEIISASINQVLEENKIQIVGILACLQGLKEQGCNGAVSDSIKTINDFINESAHKEI